MAIIWMVIYKLYALCHFLSSKASGEPKNRVVALCCVIAKSVGWPDMVDEIEEVRADGAVSMCRPVGGYSRAQASLRRGTVSAALDLLLFAVWVFTTKWPGRWRTRSPRYSGHKCANLRTN
jgi:hypothetical protein